MDINLFSFRLVLSKNPNSIFLENNDVVVFEGFSHKFNSGLNNEGNESDLINLTITAGNLFKGDCERNEYQFMINNSILNGTISNWSNVEFVLNLSQPSDLPSKNSSCNIVEYNENQKTYNIKCKLDFESQLECIKKIGNKADLTIENNPDYKVIDGYNISFFGFENKSTIISIKAGTLQKDADGENITIISFKNNVIDYNLTQSISFDINYQINGEEGTSKCTLENESKIMKFKIYRAINEIINLTIVRNPKISYQER